MGKANGKYLGQSKWIQLDENNKPTGEVKIVDEFEAELDTRRNGFMITYMTAIISLIEKLGTKKMAVVKYIFENMSKSENTLIITTRELSEKSKVSKPVVIETLKILEDANLISRKTGAIMLSAKLMHRGNQNKERYLMTKFSSFKDKEKP
ncbi:replication/maintenance protein RepL (plasmid) [Peptostreptococcaceae bacterium AGR-M142]